MAPRDEGQPRFLIVYRGISARPRAAAGCLQAPVQTERSGRRIPRRRHSSETIDEKKKNRWPVEVARRRWSIPRHGAEQGTSCRRTKRVPVDRPWFKRRGDEAQVGQRARNIRRKWSRGSERCNKYRGSGRRGCLGDTARSARRRAGPRNRAERRTCPGRVRGMAGDVERTRQGGN